MATSSKIDYILDHLSIPQYFDLVILPNMRDYYSDITVDFELRPVTRCPLHSESTGSFRYRADGEFFYCFGCGSGGNVIKLHQLFMEKEYGLTLTWDETVNEVHRLATARGTKLIKNPFAVEKTVLNNSTALLKFSLSVNKFVRYVTQTPMENALRFYLISELDYCRSGVLGQHMEANSAITHLNKISSILVRDRLQGVHNLDSLKKLQDM